jgi:heme-degrading monooxygenase HmoA
MLLTRTLLLVVLFLVFNFCTTVSSEENNNMIKSTYSIIWKYRIKPEHREVFEREYGSSGTWARLFNQSPHYQGSYLHQSEEEIDTYILIDTWVSKQTYEDFKESNARRYNELSDQFASLYHTEENLGNYNAVK